MSFLSVCPFLLMWIGLSIAERFQRQQLLTKAREHEADSDETAQSDAPDQFMIQHVWTLLDRAMGLLFVLGLPIVLSAVLGRRIFLDSSLLDTLILAVGIGVIVAVSFRYRLWKPAKARATELFVADHGHAVG